MKSFFNILFGLSVATFILLALLLLLSVFRLPFFPLESRSVLTGSMAPAIPTGSVVFIYPQASYGEGDIITFRPAGSAVALPITHRIVAVLPQGDGTTHFVTMGDANQAEDAETVSHSDIYGKVIFHIPWLGLLLDFVRTPLGFALLIIVPALLVVYDESKKIVRIVRAERNKVKNETTVVVAGADPSSTDTARPTSVAVTDRDKENNPTLQSDKSNSKLWTPKTFTHKTTHPWLQ